MLAARFGHAAVVRLIVAKGCDVNAKDGVSSQHAQLEVANETIARFHCVALCSRKCTDGCREIASGGRRSSRFQKQRTRSQSSQRMA
jgi:hypothetical protein